MLSNPKKNGKVVYHLTDEAKTMLEEKVNVSSVTDVIADNLMTYLFNGVEI